MTSGVISLPQRSFSVSSICFYTDLSRASAPIVALGAIAEIVVPRLRGLALLARTGLSAEETSLLSGIALRRLENPSEFLVSEFDIAWEQAASGHALEFLAARHSGSIHVSNPENCSIQRTISAEISQLKVELGDLLNRELHRSLSALLGAQQVIVPASPAEFPEDSRTRFLPIAA